MKNDFDLDRIADVPDPLSGIALVPVSPRRIASLGVKAA